MKNYIYHIFTRLSIIILIWVVIGCSQTPSEQTLRQFKEVLESVENYKYGDSRSWLQQFHDVLAKIYNDPIIQPEAEKLMIRILESDASEASKMLICESLGTFASKASVTVLQKMLVDEATTHMAIVALQPLPYPEVDEILINALSALKGDALVGVINALAIRKSAEAVSVLEPLIKDTDTRVSVAATFALGEIGGQESVYILFDQFQQTPGNALAEALLRGMEETSYGQNREIYQAIYDAALGISLQTAAFKGLLKHQSEEERIAYLLNTLQSSDPEFQESLIQMIRSLPENASMDVLVQSLPTFSPPFQQKLMLAIADRGDEKVRPFAIQQLSSSDEGIRMLALKALESVALPKDIPLLAKIAAGRKGSEQDLARSCIYWMKGQQANQEIISLTGTAGPGEKSELIRAIGYRKIEEGLPYSIGQISSGNSKVRLAAIETAGMIGNKDVLNAVQSKALTGVIHDQETEVIIDALTRISLNSDAPDWCATQLNESFAAFSNELPMIIIISTLGNIGSDISLNYIRPFLSADDYEIQFAALKALSAWQNDTPLPFLEEYLKTGDKDKNRQMAQVGVVNLVQSSGELTNEEKSEKLEISFLSAQSKAEKVIVLNGISRIYSLRAMDFVISQLTNPDLSTTAQEAFIRIADNLKYSYEPTVIQKIDSIAQNETDDGFKNKLNILKRSIEL